jgi:hypothetical protein
MCTDSTAGEADLAQWGGGDGRGMAVVLYFTRCNDTVCPPRPPSSVYTQEPPSPSPPPVLEQSQASLLMALEPTPCNRVLSG